MPGDNLAVLKNQLLVDTPRRGRGRPPKDKTLAGVKQTPPQAKKPVKER